MNTSVLSELHVNQMTDATHVDFIEEMRLRTWARKNYTPAVERDEDWHPIIHDEMNKIDCE